MRTVAQTAFVIMAKVWNITLMLRLTSSGLTAHLAYMLMPFNILYQWYGPDFDDIGRIHRSIAQFML